MKRWTLRIVMLLFLGAIVNVAVAWGFQLAHGNASKVLESATSLEPSAVYRELTNEEATWLERYRFYPRTTIRPYTRVTATVRTTSVKPHPGIRVRSFQETVSSTLEADQLERIRQSEYFVGSTGTWYTRELIMQTEVGWPCASMFGEYWGGTAPAGTWSNGIFRGSGIGAPSAFGLLPLSKGYMLPIHPIWPGFAINTVFYAAILFALCFGFVQSRRIIRLRRGRCPKCGYPMGQSAVCTECGVELPVKRHTGTEAQRHRGPEAS